MPTFGRRHYEETDEYPEAVTVKGWAGIAWHVLGYETEPDAETEWTGYEQRTGNLLCCMVGDDRPFAFDPDKLTPLAREDYCGECGQVGCTHDGLDRTDD